MPTAVRFLGAVNSGTSDPGFFKCDNGEDYIIKFNNPSMDRLLFNEYVVYNLATKLGLPIPEGEIVDIHPLLIMTEPFLQGRNISKVLGFKKVKIFDNNTSNGTFKMPWYKFIKGATNLKIVPDIMAFDMWIRNCDRAGLLHNYGNLIRIGNGNLNIIDHGHAMGGVTDSPTRDNNLNNPINCGFFTDGPLTRALAVHVKLDSGKNPFQSIISKINGINYNEIENIVTSASQHWPLNPGEAILVSQFLEQRKLQLSNVLDNLVYEQGYFINWKGEQLTWI